MADISKITLPSGNTYNLKDQVARDAIAALEGGSYFLGTTTTELVDNDTTNPIIVDGVSVTATNGNMVICGKKEFVFNGTKWVEFGDLSALGELAYKDFITINKGDGDIVLGEDTTFTNSSSTVSFANGTTDVVLGETTTFTSSTPTITVTPTTTNIKATASGTAVGSNGTATAITGFGTHSTDTVLGTAATFTTSVTPTTTNIKATASGTAVGANGTASAITGFGTHSTETFVKSVTAETNNKLVTTSITPTNGTETVSKVTKTASKLVTTSIPNVTGNTSVSFKDYDFSMGTGNEAETLIIGKTDKTATNTTLGTAITAATGSVASTGTGSDIVTAVTVSDKTVAKAGSAVTVATGSVSTTGSGSAVVTGVTVGDSATAITALGTPTTATCLTGVKVTTQPTVNLTTGATAGTGVISVATGITSASTTVNSPDEVTAITAIGTPTTATVLTDVKVTTQPTVSLSTGATAGTGVISVATGITSATSTQPIITVGTNDKVTAITNIGTGTAAAQTITVGTNDKVKVIKYDDLSIDSEKKTPKFNGLEIASGPLFYDGTNYGIKNSWNYSSYNSVYGKNENSCYFNFVQMGQLFEKSNFGTSDGNIENSLNPLNGWRLPTQTEFQSIVGQTRDGSTVNDSANKHYAVIQLTDATYNGHSPVYGLLIFPDGETITGATLNYMDNNLSNTITLSNLNNYLASGCAFLPNTGYYYSTNNYGWGSYGITYYWTSSQSNSGNAYYLKVDASNTNIDFNSNINKSNYYIQVRLVK